MRNVKKRVIVEEKKEFDEKQDGVELFVSKAIVSFLEPIKYRLRL